MNYVKPSVLAKSFTCPHCGTLSQQNWWYRTWTNENCVESESSIRVSYCVHCGKRTLWIRNKMYYPETGSAPFPNSQMPENVKVIYLEAAGIHSKSPRSSAALLRLCIQILCKELGEPGKNINNDISKLVQKGLPIIVQQSLDIVRVTGNEAVHPGQIDIDDPETVATLFELVNLIVEYMIALPNKVSGIYSSLPSKKLDAIKERDS